MVDHFLFEEKEQRKMEEMIISTTTKSLANQSTFTPWKLYHNPFFIHHPPHPHPQPSTYKHHHHSRQRCFNYRPRTPTFHYLGFNMAAATKPTKTELESAGAQIIQLQAELELERKMRKKMESLAKRMAKELAEERRGSEVAARLCDELASRVSYQKAEIDKIESEMEEERRMLRVADLIREERVQMKMEDAKIFYEEKMIGLEPSDDQCSKPMKVAEESACSKGERKRWVSEPENPHIKRGIKGFVEFPRGVVRSVGSNRSNRNYKLECQKAQLRILLKQRSPIQPNNLVIS